MDEFRDKLKDIQERVKSNGIVINRIPKSTRSEFMEFAKEEFCDDYGLTLKYIWDNFKIWKVFFENINYKLDNILEIISQNEQKEKSSEKSIKTISGRRIVKGGNK